MRPECTIARQKHQKNLWGATQPSPPLGGDTYSPDHNPLGAFGASIRRSRSFSFRPTTLTLPMSEARGLGKVVYYTAITCIHIHDDSQSDCSYYISSCVHEE